MFVGSKSNSQAGSKVNSRLNSQVNSQRSTPKATPTKKDGPMTIERLLSTPKNQAQKQPEFKVSPPRTRSSDKKGGAVESGSMMHKFLNPSQLMGKLTQVKAQQEKFNWKDHL